MFAAPMGSHSFTLSLHLRKISYLDCDNHIKQNVLCDCHLKQKVLCDCHLIQIINFK